MGTLSAPHCGALSGSLSTPVRTRLRGAEVRLVEPNFFPVGWLHRHANFLAEPMGQVDRLAPPTAEGHRGRLVRDKGLLTGRTNQKGHRSRLHVVSVFLLAAFLGIAAGAR